jgi:hypothetical protein
VVCRAFHTRTGGQSSVQVRKSADDRGWQCARRPPISRTGWRDWPPRSGIDTSLKGDVSWDRDGERECPATHD